MTRYLARPVDVRTGREMMGTRGVLSRTTLAGTYNSVRDFGPRYAQKFNIYRITDGRWSFIGSAQV